MSNNISEHISWLEATRTSAKVPNVPNTVQLANMKLLAENVFEPLRKLYGKPIKINSFFRSEAVNKAIKGSNTSQHTKGQAIDLDVDKDNLIIAELIMKHLEFDQLIIENVKNKSIGWIHVSYAPKNRKQVLLMVNGKYLPFASNKHLIY